MGYKVTKMIGPFAVLLFTTLTRAQDAHPTDRILGLANASEQITAFAVCAVPLMDCTTEVGTSVDALLSNPDKNLIMPLFICGYDAVKGEPVANENCLNGL